MPLEVVLSPEFEASLRQQAFDTIESGITDARRQTGIDSPWLSSKQATAKWLGIGTDALNNLIIEGLPQHERAGKYFYNKNEITEFLLNK